MATVSKTVDKTLVNGSEIFIYTINVSYSGLTEPAQSGKLVDFFPSKILYQLPQPGGQLVSITETPVSGGTNVEFNFGNVNAGTSLSFTVACEFGPGRVENDSFTNEAKLYADNAVVATGTAPTVQLQLDENFTLLKLAGIREAVQPGQMIAFRLMLRNSNDPGAEIRNIVIQDALPPELIPNLSIPPVGTDKSPAGYFDRTYDGRTGSWNGTTLNFTLPSYRGSQYEIVFQAKVSEDVTPGQVIQNVATWTVDGAAKPDAVSRFSVFQDQAKAYFQKDAPEYAEVGKPIQYSVRAVNNGTVPLSNCVLTDKLPPEVDITKLSLVSSDTVVPSYDLFVETSALPGTYQTVAENLSGDSGVYDLTDLIPVGHRVLSVRAVLDSMDTKNSSTILYLQGTVNETAKTDQVIVNAATMTADSTLGDFSTQSSATTKLNGTSILKIDKYLSPIRSAYYPLDEFTIGLIAWATDGNIMEPIFADLLPLGMDYAPGHEYFQFFDIMENKLFDSRQPGFPVALPTTEVIKDYQGTGRTLVRFKFQEFMLLFPNNLRVFFGALVTLNPPNSFSNVGYLGNPGDNTTVDGTAVTDTLDFDGDSLTNEQLAQSDAVSGTILTTSEFSLEKWVKGNLETEFSKNSSATEGGDIVYQLNVTNNQEMDLKNIEIVDILPYVGDTGVILNTTPRGSQFNVYATGAVTAEIVNVLGDPVGPNPAIQIEYSTSKDPVRFDENGTGTIGSGAWSAVPPADITTLAAVRITTGPNVILKPYERLIVTIPAKAPVGVPARKKAYNSYAVQADKISGGVTSKMNPTEPNKVSVRIADAEQGTLGDFVWSDLNGDGYQDTGEPGVNGVLVELYAADGTKLAETITANDNSGNPGYYSFTGLATGDYYVKFLPFGDYTLTTQQAGAANGSKPDPETGLTAPFTLDENQIMTSVDAGLLLPRCEPPVIHAEDRCLHVGDPFDPLSGVTATDCQGNDITADVTVTANDVDPTVEGIYSVTYSVTDEKGQTTTKTIEVRVCAISPRHQAISDLFESVALQQTALGHILNAEGEKIQKAIQLDLSAQDLLSINDSVQDMTNAIARLELVLAGKLELFGCDLCGGDCCDRK